MIKAQTLGFLRTPPLWEKEQFGIQQFTLPDADLLDTKLLPFDPRPTQGKLRLGHQIEHIFQQLIAHTDSHGILLYNLPISRNKITLGEIDFILKDKFNNKLIHVELTYKFYIIDPTFPEPVHQLIGPNRRDSFYDKMEKIKNKQFPLLHSPEGIKALEDHEIHHLDITHQCCFKAQLFQPYGSTVDLGTLNKDCIAGHWVRMADFNNPGFADDQYYIPTKSQWVIEPHDAVDWRSHERISVDIHLSLAQKRSPMIWVRRADGRMEKLFVVWW